MRLRIFSRLRKTADKRLEMLSAACAVGVAGSFGATFGGVLFSVEVTTTHYMVRRLPQATFAAVCSSLHSRSWMGRRVRAFSTHFNDKKAHSFFFYMLFILLGVACGLLGAIFNALVQLLLRLRKRLAPDNHLRHGKLGGWTMLRNQLFVVWCPLLYISRRWRGRSSPCCVLVTLNLFEVCLQVLIKKTMISLIRSSCGHTCQPSSSTRRFLS